MKVCSKCKIEKPFEAFHRNATISDGYHSSCIECEKLRKLELKKNPLMQLEKQIRSSIMLENKLLKRENKKLCSICKKIFLIDDLVGGIFCAECECERNKEYREKNKEKVREYREKNKEKINEYSKEYYEKNKEKAREYREKNKEKTKERMRDYYKKNKEKINEKIREYKREYQREYRLKKKLEKQNNT